MSDPAVAVPAPSSAPPAAPAPVARLAHRARRVRGAIVAFAGVGAVLGGLAGYWNTFQTLRVVASPSVAAATVARGGQAAAGALSILVLPFANHTGDPQKEYIADALTASITSDLVRIRDAFVIPAATAYAYKDKPAKVQQVGRDEGVHFVLTGSVLSGGDKLRILVQLADTLTGAQLWSDTFDGEMADLMALQSQVTARIGSSISREMVIVSAKGSEHHKGGAKAADLRLRARALSLQPQSRDTWARIEALERQILVLEPDDQKTRLALATTLMSSTYEDYQGPQKAAQQEQRYAEARSLALQAAQSDPDNPMVHEVLGMYALTHGDLRQARKAYETRLAIEPNDPGALNSLAMSYMDGPVGARRAIELLTRAIELNPRHPGDYVMINLGEAYFIAGDNDNAVSWLLRARQANPNFHEIGEYLAMAYADQGDMVRAQATAAEVQRARAAAQRPNRLVDFEQSNSYDTDDYRAYRQARLLPMWRKAGLPE